MSERAPQRMEEHPASGAPDDTTSRSHDGATSRRIGILAGGGRLPLTIAESVIARGGSVHIVAIEGEAEADIARFPHTWVNWGQVGRMVTTLRSLRTDALVLVGTVRRPDLWKLRPDLGFFLSLPQILKMLAGGDDSVLSRVVRFFEAKGIEVRGAHEVAPDLLAIGGPAGALRLDGRARADAELGFAVRAALGPLDAGQAVVVADGKVLAIEGAEGTDAMLARVAGLREGAARGGVLAKGPKPGQELRVDMPAIGPRTVEGAAAAGLAGLAVEAGAVLLLDRDKAVGAADGGGVAIEGLPAPADPEKERTIGIRREASHSIPPPLVGGGQGGEDSGTSEVGSPSTPSPAPQEGRESRLARGQRRPNMQPSPIHIVGGLRPNQRASADIAKALAAVQCLTPFETGRAVVVARAYILAIAAAESTSAMLERVRALRQWGVGAKRRVGVLACRAGISEWDTAAVEDLLTRAAAAGLAGIAVTGPPAALTAFEAAGAAADRNGLILAILGEQP